MKKENKSKLTNFRITPLNHGTLKAYAKSKHSSMTAILEHWIENIQSAV
jgi:hypothetical protein